MQYMKVGGIMAFDTFDEGINYGGIRSKNEIRTLICYLYNSTQKPMDKSTVVEAIQEESLANYFETMSCFDDLITHKNIELVDEKEKLYFITKNGEMIAEQLDFTLATSVKEKAYTCAIRLLKQKQIEKENAVTITKTDLGYNVNCRISGGDIDLISLDVYAPDKNQAKIMKKNFHKNPELFYNILIGGLTGNNNIISESLEEISKHIKRKD